MTGEDAELGAEAAATEAAASLALDPARPRSEWARAAVRFGLEARRGKWPNLAPPWPWPWPWLWLKRMLLPALADRALGDFMLSRAM
jgi:hypothetical protein